MNNRIIVISICVLTLFSCRKDNEVPTQIRGKEYSPLKIGKYVVYDVEKISYNGCFYVVADCSTLTFTDTNGYADTSIFQIKEEIADNYVDSEGDTVFVLHRYQRENPTESWSVTPDSVWTAKYKINQFIRTENNIPFIKLAFPVNKKTSWNGHLYNALELSAICGIQVDSIFEYDSIKVARTVGGINFENTLKVVHNRVDDNQLGLISRYEYFAEGVGMVEKHYYQVCYCVNDPNDSTDCWSGNKIKGDGSEIHYVLYEHN